MSEAKQPWRGKRGATRPATQRLFEAFNIHLLDRLKAAIDGSQPMEPAVLKVCADWLYDLHRMGVPLWRGGAIPKPTAAGDFVQAAVRAAKDKAELSVLKLSLPDEEPRTVHG